jgi:hypothetical protein
MVVQTTDKEATVQLESKPKCVSVERAGLILERMQENEPMDIITAAQTASSSTLREQDLVVHEVAKDTTGYWDAEALPLEENAMEDPQTPVYEDLNGLSNAGALKYPQDVQSTHDDLDDVVSPDIVPAWVSKGALVRLTDMEGNDDNSTELFIVTRHDSDSVYLRNYDGPDGRLMSRLFRHVIPLNRYDLEDFVRITEENHPHFGRVGKVVDHDPERQDITIELLDHSPGETPTITVPSDTSVCRMAQR